MTCRLCRSDTQQLQYVVNDCRLLLCYRCGLLQVDQEEPSGEQQEQMYSASYFVHSKYNDTATLHREYRRRLRLMNKVLGNGSFRVLEFGCGDGSFIAFAGDRFDMWGIDISNTAIAEARERYPALRNRFQAGRLAEVSFASLTFDAVVLWDTLEHIWDPASVCAQLFRLLKPGGYLLLSTPNRGALFARLTGRYWPFMTPPEHLGLFSRPSIAYLAREILGGALVSWSSKGKWANLGFLLYKVNRIFPDGMPIPLQRLLQHRRLDKWAVYVPTGDIQYAAIRKSIGVNDDVALPRRADAIELSTVTKSSERKNACLEFSRGDGIEKASISRQKLSLYVIAGNS